MVTIYELQQLGKEVVEMAVLARASDKLDEISADNHTYNTELKRQDAINAALSEDSMASYRSEFECIIRWLNDIDGIDEGGNDMLASSYTRLAAEEFGKLEFEDGEFVGSPDFELMEEHTRLYGVIVKESMGASFTAFGEEFLVPMPRMWQFQTAIAMALGESAKLTNELYNRAREDAATLATEAKELFAGLAGYGNKSGAATLFGLLSLVVGLVSYAAGPVGPIATTIGNFLTTAGLLNSSPPPKEAPKSETVTGDTAIGIRDSLNFALDEHVLIPLRDGEVKMQEALMAMNDFLDNPETRANVVAEDMSFPK